jgi:hypothetical protein
MRIDQFIARLPDGGARNNLFRVNGTFPQGTGGNVTDLLEFHCKAARIPSSTLEPIPLPFRGRVAKIAGDRTFEPWNITILNESDFPLRNAFEAWSELINDNLLNVGQGGTGHRFSVYRQDWTVTQLGRNGEDLETYTFHACWPSQIAEIPLSFEQNNTVEEFDVTLEYQYYTHTRGTKGRAVGGRGSNISG